MSEERQQERPKLPPQLQVKFDDLEKHRKRLLKDAAFLRPDQLRLHVGTTLYPAIVDIIQDLAYAFLDTYGLAVSNTNQIRRMHTWAVDEFNRLGADVGDSDVPGVSTEVLNDFQQAFFSIGALLQKKLPEDKEMQDAYNRCAKIVAEMVRELMGDDYYDEDDDDRDDEDDDRDDDDRDDDESESESEGDAEDEEPADAEDADDPEKDSTDGE